MRRTIQRQVILEELRGTTSHPRAADLFERVRRRIPTVSFGTVYRNLRQLRDQGLIQELSLGDDASRWDANATPHYHFTCRGCGAVLDLDIDPDGELERRVSQRSGLSIQGHRAEFYGLCPGCQASSPGPGPNRASVDRK